MKPGQEDCKSGGSPECTVRSCLREKGREVRGRGREREEERREKGEQAKDHKQRTKDWTSRKQNVKRKSTKS